MRATSSAFSAAVSSHPASVEPPKPRLMGLRSRLSRCVRTWLRCASSPHHHVCGRGQEELLPEELDGQPREQAEQGRVLQHAAAQWVEGGDVAEARGLDEAGHAELGVAAELERVAQIRVHAAEDDVDERPALGGVHPHLAVAEHQVLGFDEGIAQQRGEESLLVGGLRAGAGPEEDPLGGVSGAGGELLQPGPHRREVAAQPRRAGVVVQVCHHAGGEPAVRHRVAHARRGIGAVGQHGPRSPGVAAQVRGGQRQPGMARRLDAARAVQEPVVAPHDLRGQRARGKEPLLAVQVPQHQAEQAGPLLEAGLQRVPFVGPDDEGKRVDHPGEAQFAAVVDALVLDQAVQLLTGRLQPPQAERSDGALEERLPGRGFSPGGELVPARAQPPTVGRQMAGRGCRGCHTRHLSGAPGGGRSCRRRWTTSGPLPTAARGAAWAVHRSLRRAAPSPLPEEGRPRSGVACLEGL